MRSTKRITINNWSPSNGHPLILQCRDPLHSFWVLTINGKEKNIPYYLGWVLDPSLGDIGGFFIQIGDSVSFHYENEQHVYSMRHRRLNKLFLPVDPPRREIDILDSIEESIEESTEDSSVLKGLTGDFELDRIIELHNIFLLKVRYGHTPTPEESTEALERFRYIKNQVCKN